MTLLTGLVAGHTASGELTTLVANRAYPITAPQNPVYPYYVFQRISTPSRAASHQGDSQLEQVRVQFTTNAQTALQTDALAETIKRVYLGYKGILGDVFVSGATLASDLDGYDPVTKTYQRMVDLMFWVRPTA